MKKQLILILFTMAFMPFCATAETEKPTKESFIQAWENQISTLPSTIKFEKTETENVYHFETTLFDYKGRLKLLGVVIDDHVDYYYDYEIEQSSDIIGVAEVKLIDAPKDFFTNRNQTYEIWQTQQYLFFDPKADNWLNATQWKETHVATSNEHYGYCAQTHSLKNTLTRWAPFGILIIFLLFLIGGLRKQQKSQMEKYDLSMDRQKQAIDEQKRALEIAEKSLTLQEEQVKLLKEILNKGKS